MDNLSNFLNHYLNTYLYVNADKLTYAARSPPPRAQSRMRAAALAWLVVSALAAASAQLPVVLHAWSFPDDVIGTAYAILADGGAAVPAVVRGTQQAELNPEVHNVGIGGTPDSAGETSLDAMLVDGDTLDMGAVGALRGVPSAIYTASLVLRHTEHSLLVGDQATDFARKFGQQNVGDITTDYSAAAHARWVGRDCQPNFWRDVTGTDSCGAVLDRPSGSITSMAPTDPGPGTAWPYGSVVEARGSLWEAAAAQGNGSYPAPGATAYGRRRRAQGQEEELYAYIGGEGNHDTIPMLAVDSSGSIAAATTTNGLSYTIPGRVGDSPIPGAGNYAITGVGGCGATGDGDIMMRFLPCYQAVESLRLGMSPKDAAEDAIARIREYYPQFSGAVIVVDAEGNHAGATNDDRRPFPYTFQSAHMATPEVVMVDADRGYTRPAVALSGGGSGVVPLSSGVGGASLLLIMLAVLVVGGLGGYRMANAMNDHRLMRERRKAGTYATVDTSE